MAEEGSGLVAGPVELTAVPGFGFLPTHVVEFTNILFQVKNMLKSSVKYKLSNI